VITLHNKKKAVEQPRKKQAQSNSCRHVRAHKKHSSMACKPTLFVKSQAKENEALP